jgi:short-chain fatty acids transporter
LRAAFIITIFSAVAFWINWGIALVLGAMLAREIAREVKGVDYRLLIAMSYSGICITQGGIGGSITLQVALAGALNKIAPSVFVAADLIPITQTIFSPYNLVICALFAIIMPFVAVKMHPKAEETFEVDPAILAEVAIEEKKLSFKEMTPAERIENSKIVWAIIVVLGFAYIVYHFATKGFDLNINITNFILLMVGVLLHGPNLINYVKAIAASIHSVAGVMLQFPFYAGIMGMMIGTNGSGVSLASVLSNAFVAISTVKTFPYFTYLSAGIVNFFIPSGGGQWAVQGPIMMVAGDSLGVEPAKTVMAISYGDAWTNLIQPFWALPTLAVAKLKARDIMGYLVVALIVSFIITTFGLLVLA